MTNIAWIGLGEMGVRMAHRLLDEGHDLWVWNRTSSRANPLIAAGAQAASIPAEAVRHADVTFLMLTDPAALREVSEGPGGVAGAAAAGTTVIDMSTVGPGAVSRLRTVLPEAVALLDAPVLGSLAEAEAGTLTLLIGGPANAVSAARPLLSELGDPLHLGPSGAGAAAKLMASSALFGTLGVLGEALAMADGLGLPRDVAWQVLACTPLASQVQRRRPTLESGVHPRRFGLALARKDADLIVAAADAIGRKGRIARAVQSWLVEADAAGMGAEDYTAMLSHILSSTVTPADVRDAVLTTANAPHYQCGNGCDGWRLVDTAGLSVIEERMPPGTAEQWHLHDHARQFFYILNGQATMRTGEADVILHVGAGISITPGAPHQISNTADADLRFLVISAPTTRGDRRARPSPDSARDTA